MCPTGPQNPQHPCHATCCPSPAHPFSARGCRATRSRHGPRVRVYESGGSCSTLTYGRWRVRGAPFGSRANFFFFCSRAPPPSSLFASITTNDERRRNRGWAAAHVPVEAKLQTEVRFACAPHQLPLYLTVVVVCVRIKLCVSSYVVSNIFLSTVLGRLSMRCGRSSKACSKRSCKGAHTT